MKKVTLLVDDKMEKELAELQSRLFSDNLSYIIRYSVHQFFLQGAISNEISVSNSIPTVNLPGMNERIVRTQMERWQLTGEEYSAIVQKLINDFAASGGTMKNPENVIWKACSRYAHERDIQKKAAAAQTATPSDGSAEQPKVKPDGSLENVYDLQERLG